MFSCKICNKAFATKGALGGHMRRHSSSPHTISEKTREKINNEKQARRDAYLLNPKTCINCKGIIPYLKQTQLSFCSSSCSATHNNSKRGARNEETKIKISASVSNFHLNKPDPYGRRLVKDEQIGPHSKIFHVTCAHCGVKHINRLNVKYCSDHKELYKSNSANRFVFKFNIYHYPDLFDLDYLREIGWYDSVNNKNGLTRDHRISRNEAIRNDYDAYYIRHPINCELMPFLDNIKKFTKSSISYSELVELVNQYDLIQKINNMDNI